TDGGAVPATIGILDGSVRVGMTAAEIERLAAAKDVSKVNLSNLAVLLTDRKAGSTTVAATLFIAARVGIAVFATGGIGGVPGGGRERAFRAADGDGRRGRESQPSGERDAAGSLRALARHGARRRLVPEHPRASGDAVPARAHARAHRRRQRVLEPGAAREQR